MEESCLMTNCQIAEAIFFARHLVLSSQSAVKIFLCFRLLVGHTLISSKSLPCIFSLPAFLDMAAEYPQFGCSQKLGHKKPLRVEQLHML